MAIRKCPRCELNYILDDSPYCTVCAREMKGVERRDTLFEFCSVCNENPALPGKDMCLFCQKEMESVESLAKKAEPADDPLELDEASEMEEIAIDTEEDDIPVPELGEIDRELSLDDVLAEEEADGDEESEEEDM